MLPDCIIIGAQKSGTTSLYRYIIQHPILLGSNPKEVHYFDDSYHKKLGWYRSHFPIRSSKMCIEATPKYMFDKDSFRNLKSFLPDVKLIATLREPVERAYSHYKHVCRGMRGVTETRSFPEAVRADLDVLRKERILGNGSREDTYYSYIRRGIYAPQLSRFLEAYGDRLLVLRSGDLFKSPVSTMKDVFHHLGCEPVKIEANVYNQGDQEEEEIPCREELEEVFEPYNRQLYELLGVSEWWNY
nr:sulfotransferase domain-containing protein [Salinibacter ruber]